MDNTRGFKGKKYNFNMPDRSVLHSCDEVDNYHNLCSGLTYLRICKG